MEVRSAEEHELDSLAKVWYDSWNDAHAHLVPAELTRLRTPANFRERLKESLPHIRVVGPPGAPVGFCVQASNVNSASEKAGLVEDFISDPIIRLVVRLPDPTASDLCFRLL